MTTLQWLSLVSLLAGIAARIAIPWFQARSNDPSLSWAWRYVWPEILGFVVVVLGLPMLVPDLQNVVLSLGWQAAWVVGVGAAEAGNIVIGRPVRKEMAKRDI
jgi:hypothetical protein